LFARDGQDLRKRSFVVRVSGADSHDSPLPEVENDRVMLCHGESVSTDRARFVTKQELQSIERSCSVAL
jgi:hypothetical protein